MNLYEKVAEFTCKEDGLPLTSKASAYTIFYWNLFDRSTPEVPISSEESEDAAEEFDRSSQILVLVV